MSEVGKISGQMLEDNLERSDVDLAFETDLLYLDVANRRIGANSSTPYSTFLVDNTLKTDNLIVDNQTSIADLTFYGNTIQNVTGPITLSSNQNVVYAPAWTTSAGLKLNLNDIKTTNASQDINIRPTGTGKTNFQSNVLVNGNLHATGDVTFDGNLIFGNNSSDSVNFKADISSNVIPATTETYNLGTSNYRWNNLYSANTAIDSYSSSGSLIANNIDLTKTQGKIWYVATNGLDTNNGNHESAPYATVKHALSVAQSGDTVFIYAGTYVESFPLTVPQGVTVKGQGLRAVTISPTVSTNYNDCFLLNGETTVSDLAVSNFYYDPNNDTGYAFRFADGMRVTTKSPYVQNVSVITKEP